MAKKKVSKKKVSKKKVSEKKVSEKKETRSIEELLKLLDKATDTKEKRKLRAELRKAGHTGGLRKPKTSKKKEA
jgi:hypothetical protein